MMTVEEYLQTPESVSPQELVYGMLRVADAPLPQHQRAVAQLFRALDEHVTTQLLGEVWLSPIDVILDAGRHLVLPARSVVYFAGTERDRSGSNPRRTRSRRRSPVPRPRIGEINEKVGWFATYGVNECWIVDLVARRIEVLIFAGGAVGQRRSLDPRTPIDSAVLPSFSRGLDSILGYP